MSIYILVIAISALTYVLTIIILHNLTKRKQDISRRINTYTKEKKEVYKTSNTDKRAKLNNLFQVLDLKFVDKLTNELAMSGIPLRVEEYLAIWILSSVGTSGFAAFFGAEILVVLGLFIVGLVIPIFILKFKKSKRINLFDKQLTDAMTIMCNCLRTGFSFQTAIESVAKEMPEPISLEFGRMLRERNLGLTLEYSLSQMVERTGNKDLELISNAVLIQRQVGGNLAEVLDSISDTVKERVKIGQEIKVLTSTGRISGYIVGLLPVFILVLLMIINPKYVEIFFITTNGQMLLGVCVVLEIVGFAFVKKIVTVKF